MMQKEVLTKEQQALVDKANRECWSPPLKAALYSLVDSLAERNQLDALAQELSDEIIALHKAAAARAELWDILRKKCITQDLD